MPTRRSTPKPLTGTASGSLGTAANLEDTQVMSTAELQSAAAAVEAERARGDADVPDVDAPSRPVVVAPPPPIATAPVMAAKAPRRRESRSDAGRGLAGVLGVALVVLLGMAVIVAWGDGTVGGVQANPSLVAPASIAPEASPEASDGKGKDCRGNGKGKGNCPEPREEGGD